MIKTKFVVLFMFISLVGFCQINNENKDQDDHKKTEKIIDSLLKNEQLDSALINIVKEQAIPETEKAVPFAAPTLTRSINNIKSEPVPGAEIIIDKEPVTDKKKNKIKATNNQIETKNNENNETNKDKNKEH